MEEGKKVISIETGAPLSRGMRIWNNIRDFRDTNRLSLNRALLVTEAYKETEGMPSILRRAHAHAKVLDNIPIYIDDEQLLVGDFGSSPMVFEWFPELTVRWVKDAIDGGWFTYKLEKDEIPKTLEIVKYWKDREAKQLFLNYINTTNADFFKKLCTVNEKGSLAIFAETEAALEKGWHVPNYEKVIKVGFSGIIDEINAELTKTKLLDNHSYEKFNLLTAMKSTMEAGIRFAKRYEILAREKAKMAKGVRKDELLKIADTCGTIFEKPARTFRDCIQAMFLTHSIIFWDCRCPGISYGRADQYLQPYYARDIASGEITREDAIELLECHRVKCSSQRNFDSKTMRIVHSAEMKTSEGRAGETQFHNVTLAGQLTDGVDATTDVSYLWLEAATRVRTAHPTLTVRWHPGINRDFCMAAARVNRFGLGFPAWYNDATTIPYFEERGVTHEDALNYVISGCVLHTIPYKSPCAWPGVCNIPKIFEFALFNGYDHLRKTQVGPKTGDFLNMSYDDLIEAFMKQLDYFFSIQKDFLNMVRVFRAHELTNLTTSCLVDDCITRGDTVFGGGAHYQISAQYLQPLGMPDVGDSLSAIRKCVFEDKSVGKEELLAALKANFEGYEAIRKKLLAAPKFGNDDDYADEIVSEMYERIFAYAHRIDTPYGSKYEVAPHSLSFHGAAGSKVGALPSGRLESVSLNDAGCSPCQGMDTCGPSAAVNSAGKINHTQIYGCLFNLKFHPSALATDEDLEKFIDLISTYFDELGGKHIQFNVVDRAVLLDAQEHPEKHRNLVVRVAGYSAIFVELNSQIQNEIIARTAHQF